MLRAYKKKRFSDDQLKMIEFCNSVLTRYQRRWRGGKNVKSTDERKPRIVAAMKRRAAAQKVTLLKEFWTESGAAGGHYFEGHCLRYSDNGYQSIGYVTIAASEAGIE